MKNILLSVSAGILLLILMCGMLFQNTDSALPISAYIKSDNEIEQINGWVDEAGAVYLFLPSYAELTEVRINNETETPLTIGVEELSESMTLDRYQVCVPYRLVYKSGNRLHETKVTFLQSEKLPTLYVDTQSGSMEYVHAQKGNEEPGTIRLYTPDGMLGYSGKIREINGRGNATWEMCEKKPYSLKLEKEADLLGMGTAEKWVLLANAQDPSHIRNKLANELANMLGLPYTVESEWVDLYLNGTYAGLYLLSEKNEVHPQRVNLEKLDFLVSMEKEERLEVQNYPYIRTEQGLALRLHYLSDNIINADAMVESLFESVENALLSEDGIDPETGRSWDELIDIESWTRMFLLDEIIGNLDSFKASQYFYGDFQRSRIFAGPIWDSDKAMGNDNDNNWSVPNPDVFMVCRYQEDDFVGPRWVRSLLQKKQFYDKVVALFLNEFYPVVENSLDKIIQQYEDEIAKAVELNRVRWYNEVNAGSIQEEFGQVRDYIHEHMAFLYSVWVKKIPYCQVSFLDGPTDKFRSVLFGETLKSIPTADDTQTQMFLGWFHEGTEEPFDVNEPITENIVLYARWKDRSAKQKTAEAMSRIFMLIPLCIVGIVSICLFQADLRRGKKVSDSL